MHRFSMENFSRTRPGMGAGRATQYLTRTGEFADQNADRVETIRTDATFQIEHMTGENSPEGHRNDLRHVEVNNLPGWAHGDPGSFFRAAEKYERGGSQRGGRFYSIMELSVPRELDRPQQLELARGFVTAILPDNVNLWVLHEPMARNGSPQPHIHIMFSARHIGDGSKGERVFFKTPTVADPERGGFGKDRFFAEQRAPRQLRQAWTDLTNIALERAGVPRRVTADPLHRQGLHPLYAYQQPGDYRQQEHTYAPRSAEERAQHQQYATAQWAARKQVLGLPSDLRRTDLSAVVQAIGRQAKQGTSARDVGAPPPKRVITPVRGRAPREPQPAATEDLDRRWELPLIGNKHSRIYHTYQHKNYGDVHPKNQVRFWTEREAQDAGYRRAANAHYGPGTGWPMTVEEARQRLRQGERGQGQPGQRRALLALLGRARSVIEAGGGGGALRIQLYRDKEQGQGVSW